MLMATVLLTAFGPYEHWQENSSWLALVELTKQLPSSPRVTTRLYPVDFGAVREQLQRDLSGDYDFVLQLGQAPGSSVIRLESMAVNIGGGSHQPPEDFQPLIAEGPVAYRSALPLHDWSRKLRQAGIPARVSYHAGTFLCNAALYYVHHFSEQLGKPTRAAFIHLPLAPSQVLHERQDLATMPTEITAAALQLVLRELHDEQLG
jgi:pyroglutamyl-peptidase